MSSTPSSATPPAALREVRTPTLVVIGDQDNDHASTDTLAATLPSARFTRVPGNHVTALSSPELVAAITAFLARSSSRADLRNE